LFKWKERIFWQGCQLVYLHTKNYN
jgi:hypothetical protein